MNIRLESLGHLRPPSSEPWPRQPIPRIFCASKPKTRKPLGFVAASSTFLVSAAFPAVPTVAVAAPIAVAAVPAVFAAAPVDESPRTAAAGVAAAAAAALVAYAAVAVEAHLCPSLGWPGTVEAVPRRPAAGHDCHDAAYAYYACASASHGDDCAPGAPRSGWHGDACRGGGPASTTRRGHSHYKTLALWHFEGPLIRETLLPRDDGGGGGGGDGHLPDGAHAPPQPKVRVGWPPVRTWRPP